ARPPPRRRARRSARRASWPPRRRGRLRGVLPPSRRAGGKAHRDARPGPWPGARRSPPPFPASSQLLHYAPQYAVYESGRVGAAIELRGLDRLIDRDLVRNVRPMDDLVERDAQDRPFERSNPVEVPVHRMIGDQAIELLTVGLDALGELTRERREPGPRSVLDTVLRG